ncbi:PfkB family carbohydrate kinase [Afifella sp. IM 167]|uniref:PfkB family carbohydrate kinase n=1 Tax=Afifella sp. IM 167 TaxID=2033586 RepID=UPI001CCC6C1F|nr:PfkB family carbohydrate kinase [Afifella sp. IM 167]MBZ8132829.1 pyridoxal kinase [Afifella sp. IM 167]
MSVPGPVVTISSHVAIGAVGNRIISFVLERLGIETVEIPTIIFPHHPAHRRVRPLRPSPEDFAELLENVAERLKARPPSAVVTGYFGGRPEAELAASFIEELKRRDERLLYLCDPVFGDAGEAYLPQEVVEAQRRALLPLADIATPNLFEFSVLAGLGPSPEMAAIAAAAADLGPAELIVTSAPALMRGRTAAALFSGGATLLAEHPLAQTPAKGAGDLFCAVYLGRRLLGSPPQEALPYAVAATHDVFAVTASLGRPDLAFAEAQEALVRPNLSRVQLRRLAGAPAVATRP